MERYSQGCPIPIPTLLVSTLVPKPYSTTVIFLFILLVFVYAKISKYIYFYFSFLTQKVTCYIYSVAPCFLFLLRVYLRNSFISGHRGHPHCMSWLLHTTLCGYTTFYLSPIEGNYFVSIYLLS